MPVALLLALAAPAVAHAGAGVSVTGTTMTFTIDDALDHHSDAFATDAGDVVITDDAGIAADSGCAALDAHRAICGPAAALDLATFDFGSGADVLSVSTSFPISVTGDGGAGDVISCGPGTDTSALTIATPFPTTARSSSRRMLAEDMRIIGEARVGNVLELVPPVNTGGAGSATVLWERCDATGLNCSGIYGASGLRYTLERGDQSNRLRARYRVTNLLGEDEWESAPTALVAEALRPTPTPRPRSGSCSPGARTPLLRAHHKLTLLINATITRPHSAPVKATFTITVKTRARKPR